MGHTNLHTGHRARLKEEFRARGLEGWPDHKVLELLLCYAIPQGDVNPLAHRLIEAFGDLSGVLDASPEALKKIPGMGDHSAGLVKLVPQVCGRYLSQTTGVQDSETAERVADYVRTFFPYFTGATREKFLLLSLDSRRKILGVDVVGEGELAQVQVSPRRVMEAALAHNARGVVLAHNHVGAYATPSAEDTIATQNLWYVLSMVNVDLVDHLIFCGDEFISMEESGKIIRTPPRQE